MHNCVCAGVQEIPVGRPKPERLTRKEAAKAAAAAASADPGADGPAGAGAAGGAAAAAAEEPEQVGAGRFAAARQQHVNLHSMCAAAAAPAVIGPLVLSTVQQLQTGGVARGC